MNDRRQKLMTWTARVLVGIVTFLNLQAAISFIFQPADYAQAFELSGEAGLAMIQGVGLLFLMWNIPYIFAFANPQRNFVSLVEAVIMQFIGVVGESAILFTTPGSHPVLHASVCRFILFDGSGFIALVIALTLVFVVRRKPISD